MWIRWTCVADDSNRARERSLRYRWSSPEPAAKQDGLAAADDTQVATPGNGSTTQAAEEMRSTEGMRQLVVRIAVGQGRRHSSVVGTWQKFSRQAAEKQGQGHKSRRSASTIPSAPTTQSFTTIYDLDPSYISPKATSADPALTTPRTESQNIETEKNEDNKLPHIIASVVILSIALISAAALIFRYRHCIRKTKDSTRCLPIISLEGLERTEDQTEQNIYTIS
ncbi:uncharacterized protein LOC130267410 isoform X4 [Hyla sarda]|uniref:uncharacterized protein LOC130267410 isoform X4 n=1 Tax=Hyla sarda TaxID=327740 RepID=UPI0024C44D99|nr:uncharacterized protein LOC130267410 isoform X4 [Hyla sarda]